MDFCNPTSILVTEVRNSRQLQASRVWLDWEKKYASAFSLELLATAGQPSRGRASGWLVRRGLVRQLNVLDASR